MADAKSKKTTSTKKIVDVKHESDGASGNSRSIIVNNRPILKDPMMAEVSKLTGESSPEPEDHPANSPKEEPKPEDTTPTPEESPKETKAPSTTRTRIIPLTDEEKDDDTKPAKAKDEPTENAKDDDADKQAEAATAPPLAKGTAAKAEATPKGEQSPRGKTIEPPKASEDADKATPDFSEASEPAPEASSESPAEDVARGGDDKDGEADESPVALPGDPVKDESAAVMPGRSFDDSTGPSGDSRDPQAPSVDGNAGADEKKEPEKPNYAKLTPEQEQAVESGEFFLPIKTAEGKRLRREIIITVLVVVVLIVIWIDVMLDAGLISIGGIEAPTNFFK